METLPCSTCWANPVCWPSSINDAAIAPDRAELYSYPVRRGSLHLPHSPKFRWRLSTNCSIQFKVVSENSPPRASLARYSSELLSPMMPMPTFKDPASVASTGKAVSKGGATVDKGTVSEDGVT